MIYYFVIIPLLVISINVSISISKVGTQVEVVYDPKYLRLETVAPANGFSEVHRDKKAILAFPDFTGKGVERTPSLKLGTIKFT